MMTKAPMKKQSFGGWKLQKMTEFGQQVQLLKLDVYSASVWRTIHGDMHAKGKKMSYAELAAKSGMSNRKAKDAVKKLESLGFLRVKRSMRGPADNEPNQYITRTLEAPALAKIKSLRDRG